MSPIRAILSPNMSPNQIKCPAIFGAASYLLNDLNDNRPES